MDISPSPSARGRARRRPVEVPHAFTRTRTSKYAKQKAKAPEKSTGPLPPIWVRGRSVDTSRFYDPIAHEPSTLLSRPISSKTASNRVTSSEPSSNTSSAVIRPPSVIGHIRHKTQEEGLSSFTNEVRSRMDNHPQNSKSQPPARWGELSHMFPGDISQTSRNTQESTPNYQGYLGASPKNDPFIDSSQSYARSHSQDLQQQSHVSRDPNFQSSASYASTSYTTSPPTRSTSRKLQPRSTYASSSLASSASQDLQPLSNPAPKFDLLVDYSPSPARSASQNVQQHSLVSPKGSLLESLRFTARRASRDVQQQSDDASSNDPGSVSSSRFYTLSHQRSAQGSSGLWDDDSCYFTDETSPKSSEYLSMPFPSLPQPQLSQGERKKTPREIQLEIELASYKATLRNEFSENLKLKKELADVKAKVSVLEHKYEKTKDILARVMRNFTPKYLLK